MANPAPILFSQTWPLACRADGIPPPPIPHALTSAPRPGEGRPPRSDRGRLGSRPARSPRRRRSEPLPVRRRENLDPPLHPGGSPERRLVWLGGGPFARPCPVDVRAVDVADTSSARERDARDEQGGARAPSDVDPVRRGHDTRSGPAPSQSEARHVVRHHLDGVESLRVPETVQGPPPQRMGGRYLVAGGDLGCRASIVPGGRQMIKVCSVITGYLLYGPRLDALRKRC